MSGRLHSSVFAILLAGSLAAHTAVLRWGSVGLARPVAGPPPPELTEILLVEPPPPEEPPEEEPLPPEPEPPPPPPAPEPDPVPPPADLPAEPEPAPQPEPQLPPRHSATPQPTPRPAPAVTRPARVAPPKPAPAAVEARADTSRNRPPRYPEVARRNGWEGLCILRVRVTPDGRPAAVSVHRSSGYGALDQAAVQTVRGWRFHPRSAGGRAVESVIEVPVNFSLRR